MKHVQVADLTIGNDRPLTIIAGPCQLESEDHAQMIAGRLKEACAAAGAQYVFKASYDKANRTSLSGKRGLGIDAGLKVLQSVGKANGVPVLTDVHTEAQCAIAAEAVDIVTGQIEEIHAGFDEAAEEARLTEQDRLALANRAILNPYAFEGAPEQIAAMERPL